MDFEPSPAELELVEAVRDASVAALAAPGGDPAAGADAVVVRGEPLGLFSGSTVGYVLSLSALGSVSLAVGEQVAARHPAHAREPSLGRLATAALAVGLAQQALGAAVAAVRSAGGKPRQKTEFALSDVAAELDASALAVAQAAFVRDSRRTFDLEAASAALVATRTASRALHTSLGLATDASRPGLEQSYLAARRLEAAHGGEVEAENLIASALLEET